MSTKIQWTDEVWNPIVGCSRVSPACDNCYAATAAASARLQRFPQYEKVSNWDGTVQVAESQLLKPLKWRSPKKIFACSMSDLFHENVPDEWRDEVLAIIAMCSHHRFQLLTKRPENALRYFKSNPWARILEIIDLRFVGEYPCLGHLIDDLESMDSSSFLPNIWMGTTVENQEMADKRIPLLLQIPAAVRWLSIEPLLGSIDLTSVFGLYEYDEGKFALKVGSRWANSPDWVVVGGESGAGARPMPIEWLEAIAQQCQDAGVPVFIKQLGNFPVTNNPERFAKEKAIAGINYFANFELITRRDYSHWCFSEAQKMGIKLEGMHRIKLKDRKGGNIDEFPEHLRIREFPNV